MDGPQKELASKEAGRGFEKAGRASEGVGRASQAVGSLPTTCPMGGYQKFILLLKTLIRVQAFQLVTEKRDQMDFRKKSSFICGYFAEI